MIKFSKKYGVFLNFGIYYLLPKKKMNMDKENLLDFSNLSNIIHEHHNILLFLSCFILFYPVNPVKNSSPNK